MNKIDGYIASTFIVAGFIVQNVAFAISSNMNCQQMGSLAGKTNLELEEMHLISPQSNDAKISSLEITPQRSSIGLAPEDFGCKCLLSSIARSIKVTLLSNKLNLLLPCGPLAVAVDKLTNHHVSYEFDLIEATSCYSYFVLS